MVLNALLIPRPKTKMMAKATPVIITLCVEEVNQREDRGHQSADEFHQARADQIAHAFDVAHDAGNQHAGLVGVVKGDGQPSDVGLHLAAQVGDHSLRRLRKKLRQREGSEALYDGGGEKAQNDGRKQVRPAFLPITLSTKYFADAGKTKPATRLTAISTKPSASRPRRGWISAQTSGSDFQADFFFAAGFFASGAVASLPLDRRSDRRAVVGIADRGGP